MLLSENLLKISVLKNLESRFGFRIEEPDIHSRKGNIRAEALIKAFMNNPFLASILDYNLLNKQGFLDQESKFGFKIKALNSLPRGRENS
ncbi:hypothetical protein Celaphus_00012137, partial [Cervus elaphus hippelaphus]